MLRARRNRGLSTIAGFMPLVVASGTGGRQPAGHWPGCGGRDGGGGRHVTDVYAGILCRDYAAG
jgi:hypothetical protein